MATLKEDAPARPAMVIKDGQGGDLHEDGTKHDARD